MDHKKLEDLLEAGESHPEESSISWALRHLSSLCPICRELIASRPSRRAAPAGIDEVLSRFVEQARKSVAQSTALSRAMAADLADLLAFRPEDRRPAIERARTRYRSRGLVYALLDLAEERLSFAPQESFHFAELARAVCLCSSARQTPTYLIALVDAYAANALRVELRLDEADRYLAHAALVLDSHPASDLLDQAAIFHIAGTLRKDQHLWEEAKGYLEQAAHLYREVGDAPREASVLLTQADLFYLQLDVEAAEAQARKAVILLAVDSDSRLALDALQSLALYRIEQRDIEGASLVVEEAEPLYAQFADLWTALRRRWLEAKMAGPAESVRLYLHCLEGFVWAGLDFDAALVALDLARIYLDAKIWQEVQMIAGFLAALFGAAKLPQEARAALVLLETGAFQEALAPVVLLELRSYLLLARTRPGLPFRSVLSRLPPHSPEEAE
jgi:hypothetical protein